METKKLPEIAKKYSCKLCDYACSKIYEYEKHVATRKHEKKANGNFLETAGNPKVARKQYQCEKCEKIYKSKGGLWKHNKTCANAQNGSTNNHKDKDLIQLLMKENADIKNMFQTILVDVVKSNKELQMQILETVKHTSTTNTIISNNTNNSHNKTFNLQFFLNEQCKDAMNLSEFVKSITLQLSDLESVGKLGYVEGISNIMIKKLSEMDIYKRPVHCSDAKRETLYVKDEDCWEKEPENNPRLRKAIRYISKKNSDLLTAWSDKNPASKNNQSKENNKYMVIIQQAMGGSGEIADNENKIIKKLAKVFLIEKN
jgi:hypothetical protein